MAYGLLGRMMNGMPLSDSDQQALIGLASGLSAAGQPSRIPVSFGQALGMGIGGMQDAQAQYKKDAYQKEKDQRQYEIDLAKLQSGYDAPSAVKEYEYFNSLPDDQKQRYLTVKRAQQVVNLGGTQGVLDAQGNGLAQQFPVTPKPEDMPDFKGAQAQASAVGKAVGETMGANEKKAINAPFQYAAINQARQLLPKASSGAVGAGLTFVQNVAGVSTDKSKVDRQLMVIAAELTNNVPRMEGPQSNTDVIAYKQAAADIGNSMVPYEDRLAALDVVETIARKYESASPKNNALPQLPNASKPNAAALPQKTPAPVKAKFLGFE